MKWLTTTFAFALCCAGANSADAGLLRSLGHDNCCKPKCEAPAPRCSRPKTTCCRPEPKCAEPRPCAKPEPACAQPAPQCCKVKRSRCDDPCRKNGFLSRLFRPRFHMSDWFRRGHKHDCGCGHHYHQHYTGGCGHPVPVNYQDGDSPAPIPEDQAMIPEDQAL